MKSKVFQIRRQSSLPFYCDPAPFFIFVWLIMLVAFRFKICDVCYTDFSLPVLIFAASLASFLLGYYLVRVFFWKQANLFRSARYHIEVTRLRRFTLALTCVALAIIAFNYFNAGLPPFLSAFGFTTAVYFRYGKFEQVLFPILMVIFVDSLIEPSLKRRIPYMLFAFATMLLYVARGVMVIMLLQALIVFSIRTSLSKRKIYLLSIVSLCGVALFVDIVGSNRTSNEVLFLGMQIKPEYQHWPTMYLWIISYIATPLSNLCWFVRLARFDHVTWSCLYQLLPSFWHPVYPHSNILLSNRMIDGVYTYLGMYYLDFSYFGIFLINVVIGMVAGYGSVANRISRRFLTWSAFLSCIGVIFFWDFFTYLQMVILFGIQAAAHRYFIRELPVHSPEYLES